MGVVCGGKVVLVTGTGVMAMPLEVGVVVPVVGRTPGREMVDCGRDLTAAAVGLCYIHVATIEQSICHYLEWTQTTN